MTVSANCTESIHAVRRQIADVRQQITVRRLVVFVLWSIPNRP
jgi:hypothetical protein